MISDDAQGFGHRDEDARAHTPGSHRLSAAPAVRQVLVVALAALTVQVLLPFRGDSAAHVLGGAALAMFVGVALPQRAHWHRGAATEVAIFAFVLAVAWWTETSILGPFDIVDIAFTMGGAFVALAAAPRWPSATRRDCLYLVAASFTLAGTALAYRYLLGIGEQVPLRR